MIQLRMAELDKSNDFTIEVEDTTKVLYHIPKTESVILVLEEWIPDEISRAKPKSEEETITVVKKPHKEERVVKNAWDE